MRTFFPLGHIFACGYKDILRSILSFYLSSCFNIYYSQKIWSREILNYNKCKVVYNNYKYISWNKCTKIRKEKHLNYIKCRNVVIP